MKVTDNKLEACLKALYLTKFHPNHTERSVKRRAQRYRALSLPKFGRSIWSNSTLASDGGCDVAVLITCFNYADLVGVAIESVFNSSTQNCRVELVVVDDASDDSSKEVLLSYLKSAPIPMKVIRPWWNIGLCGARNLALANTLAEYVFILDADNYIEADALSALRQRMQDTAADAAYGPIRRVRLDGTTDCFVSNLPFKPEMLRQGNYIDAMAMFRRSSLEHLGGYEIDLLRIIGGWEDYDIWLKFASQGMRVEFEPTVIGTYLVKDNSMLQQITLDERRAAMKYFGKLHGFQAAIPEE